MSAEEPNKESWQEPEEDMTEDTAPMTTRIIGKLSRWWRSPEKAGEGEAALPESPTASEEAVRLPTAPGLYPAGAVKETPPSVPAAGTSLSHKPGAGPGGSTVDHVLAILTLERVLPELDAARKQLSEQKEAAEVRLRQLEAERDQVRDERRELEGRFQTLGKALDAVEHRLREERETAEARIQELEAERDQSRADVSNARVERTRSESRVRVLEEELEAARRQLAEERAAVRTAKEPPPPAPEPAPLSPPAKEVPTPLPLSTAKALYERAVVPLTVLMASADLLMLNPRADPSLIETAQEIKTQGQTLLELIKKYTLPPEGTH